jgi:hypothetical protein
VTVDAGSGARPPDASIRGMRRFCRRGLVVTAREAEAATFSFRRGDVGPGISWAGPAERALVR